MVKIYDSVQKKIVDEPQFGGRFLHFLYNTLLGRTLLKGVFVHPWVWRQLAVLQRRPATMTRVDAYVKEYSINPAEYRGPRWRSFHDFFSRTYKSGKITFPASSKTVIAIAEGKVLAVPIDKETILTVKHRSYPLSTILGSEELAAQFSGGVALIYRLSMHNYHRYIFPDEGRLIESHSHNGVLHTISSISKAYPVYSLNKRVVSLLDTKHFSRIVTVEIGAMMVGNIANADVRHFQRGEEKGSFQIGGSTILVLYKRQTIRLSRTIQKYSQQGIEVTVKIGEALGEHV